MPSASDTGAAMVMRRHVQWSRAGSSWWRSWTSEALLRPFRRWFARSFSEWDPLSSYFRGISCLCTISLFANVQFLFIIAQFLVAQVTITHWTGMNQLKFFCKKSATRETRRARSSCRSWTEAKQVFNANELPNYHELHFSNNNESHASTLLNNCVLAPWLIYSVYSMCDTELWLKIFRNFVIYRKLFCRLDGRRRTLQISSESKEGESKIRRMMIIRG